MLPKGAFAAAALAHQAHDLALVDLQRDLSENLDQPVDGLEVDGQIFYAVADRIPRVYPWMNEPVGGMLGVWK